MAVADKAESRSQAEMRRHPNRNAGAPDSGLLVTAVQYAVPGNAAVGASSANRLALQTHAAIVVVGYHL